MGIVNVIFVVMNGDGTKLLAPEAIKVEAKRFQFRSGASGKGVTGRLSDVSEWCPLFAGLVLVYEDFDKTYTVIDGHHRVDLAKRLAKRTGQKFGIRCLVLSHKDYTTAQAKAKGILRNIAEGHASVEDMASLLRSKSIPDSELPKLPKNSKEWRFAQLYAALEQSVYNYALKLNLDPAYVQVVIEQVEGRDAQLAALAAVAEIKPRDSSLARHVVGQVTAYGIEIGDSDLFGNQDAYANIKKRAEIMLAIEKTVRTDKAVFSKLVSESDRIESAGNVLKKTTNESKLIEAKTLTCFIQSQCMFPSDTSAALAEATKSWLAGDIKKSDAVSYVIDVARVEITQANGLIAA